MCGHGRYCIASITAQLVCCLVHVTFPSHCILHGRSTNSLALTCAQHHA